MQTQHPQKLQTMVQQSQLLTPEHKQVLLEQIPTLSPEQEQELRRLLDQEQDLVTDLVEHTISEALANDDYPALISLDHCFTLGSTTLHLAEEKTQQAIAGERLKHLTDDPNT